jgi:hypothetical protein
MDVVLHSAVIFFVGQYRYRHLFYPCKSTSASKNLPFYRIMLSNRAGTVPYLVLWTKIWIQIKVGSRLFKTKLKIFTSKNKLNYF